MKRILLAFVCVLSLVSLTGCMNFLFPESEVELETKAIKLAKEVQRGEYKVLSTAELKEMMDSGAEMLIVDTMPFEDSYKKNHIPGAVQFLFPIPDMNEWDTKETDGKDVEAFRAMLGDDLDRPLVFYCGFVKCTRSHNGAVWARKLGYTNVYRHPGGIKAWAEAKYPVSTVK
ncbi:rhodanese-like domain-containing protein [Desulfovibrio psychrotolerans]|uniref:Sulfurtransferase n=1 Tax=Desulfovibrio psychrotolerans TaxID=415242 RepID=A0A7J0BSR6_9BACT|nr:rhodanese-like domain-containing protein [Desulfovibrio psychrotolerans]GFM36185.1 sulfurtransferase [Desulfovibrio psychrotolerans]